MQHKKLLFLVLMSSLSYGNAGLIQLGKGTDEDNFVAPSAPCELDDGMAARLEAGRSVVLANAQILSEVDEIEENACLPALEEIGSMINASVPSFSVGNIISQIRDAACDAANQAIERRLSAINVRANAPYGLGNVAVGVGKSGDSDNVIKESGKSVFDPLQQEAIRLGGEAGKKAANNVADKLPDTKGVNRTIKEDIDDAKDEYDDTVDSARGGLNDM